MRSFFFVLLGALVEFEALRRQVLPALGVAAVLFLARFLAVEFSRIAWRGTTRVERDVAMLLIPRGLITAVLALEVVQPMPIELSFLTPLAFGVILLTNVFVLLASIRAHPLRAEAAVPAILVAPTTAPPPAVPVAR